MKDLETKINQGLEKLIQICMNYIQYIFSTEQKKTDFRPDNGSPVNRLTSVVNISRFSYNQPLLMECEHLYDNNDNNNSDNNNNNDNNNK